MNKRKHLKHGTARNKSLLLVASMILLFAVSVVGTGAFLVDQDEPVTNVFEIAQVPNEVTEKFENDVKNNVAITNTGDTDAYIRVAVVATWVKKTGTGENATYEVAPTKPIWGTDYIWYPSNDVDEEPGYNTDYWIKGDDGFFYYIGAVAPSDSTEFLFTKCSVLDDATIPDGYTLSIEIMGQSIQADGMGTDEDGELKTPVELAWGEDAAVLVGAKSAGGSSSTEESSSADESSAASETN